MAAFQDDNENDIDVSAIRMDLLMRRRELLETSIRHGQDLDAVLDTAIPEDYRVDAQYAAAQAALAGLTEVAHRELLQIEDALARMDAGLYGTCAECGRPIESERLEALPYATLCYEDAEREEIDEHPESRPPPTL